MSQYRVFLNQYILSLGIFIFLWFIFISCAEIASPPGGEEDKVKPYIIGSEPANGSVNVPCGDRIVLYFSERVNPPQTGQSVFVSPRPIIKPKLKWKSDRLEIIFAGSFNINETYIVSASAGIADLRKNKLDSAGIIAFSTGASLDTGRIKGLVFSDESPKPGLYVALYDLAALTDSSAYDSLIPAYLTQTNSDGRFVFDYLPPREFRLVAFEDKNRDELFNPSREAFAVTDRPILLGGETSLDDLRLSMTSQDTLKPEIISATYTSNRLIRVRLSRKIPLDWFSKHLDQTSITLLNDTSLIYQALSLLEEESEESSNLTLVFPDLVEGKYKLQLKYDSASVALVSSDVVVKESEDKTPPSLVMFEPDQSSRFPDDLEIRMTFSEPLDTTKFTPETFYLWQEEPDSLLQLEWDWEDAFRLRFYSPNLSEGNNYRLVVTEFELIDRSGNALGDSLSEHHFSTLDYNSLGSISGQILKHISGQEKSPVVLKFRKVGQQQITTLLVEEQNFRIDVPAGDYLMTAYIDSDRNGKRGTGSIYPFSFAETQAAYPDTVSVRSRFETIGITFDIR